MAFEVGNKYAARGGEFKATVKRALAQNNYERLRQCVETMLDLAAAGERWAVELLRDTLDGKPAQNIIASDEEGRDLAIALIAYHPAQLQSKTLPAPSIESIGLRDQENSSGMASESGKREDIH